MSKRQPRLKVPRSPIVMVYGTPAQEEKLSRLAQYLDVSHSHLVACLIEQAFDEVFIKENHTLRGLISGQ